MNRTLDDVKETIRMKLYSEKRQKALEEWVESLKKKYNATVIEQNLSKVKVDVPPASETQQTPRPVQMNLPVKK